MIDPDVKLGKNVTIFNPEQVNIFGCDIGDGTFVGPFVEITRGVTIGKNCKVESHSFICDGVTIHNEVFIGHGVMFTNDLFPVCGRHVAYKKTVVEQGVSVGSNASIIGGVTLGRYAVVGAGAVVSRDVPPFCIVAGNPAKVTKRFATLEEMMVYMESRQPSRNSK